jgi:hypothetical protein
MESSDFSVGREQVRVCYLDGPGTYALFDQTIKDVVDEFDRLYRTNPTGGLEDKTALARRLSVLLGLGESTAGGSLCRSKKFIEEIQAKLSVQNKATRLLEYQRVLDSTGSLPTLELAVQRWRYGVPNMLLVNEHFNMPQFYQGAQSEALAYESGLVEFEIDRPTGNKLARKRLDAFTNSCLGREKRRVLMSANLSKFQDIRLGKMSPDSPDAKFFHQFGGLRVPLQVLGTLTIKKDFLLIKPLVIWREEQVIRSGFLVGSLCPNQAAPR